jgi:hypothetical protein
VRGVSEEKRVRQKLEVFKAEAEALRLEVEAFLKVSGVKQVSGDKKQKGRPIKKLIVELDLSNTDGYVHEEDIKEISITYFNWGEGIDWSEPVPFKILKVIYFES